MEDHGGIEANVQGGGVGPGDGGHFEAAVVPYVAVGVLTDVRSEDGEVPGLVEDVAGVKQTGFVDDESAAVDGQSREKGRSGDGPLVDDQPDLAKEGYDSGGDGVKHKSIVGR